jgi:hypothetical protein
MLNLLLNITFYMNRCGEAFGGCNSIYSLLWKGYKAPLSDDQIWDLRPMDRVQHLIKCLYDCWLKSSKTMGDQCDNKYGGNMNSSKLQNGGTGNEDEEMDGGQGDSRSISEKTPLLPKQTLHPLNAHAPPLSNSRHPSILASQEQVALRRLITSIMASMYSLIY